MSTEQHITALREAHRQRAEFQRLRGLGVIGRAQAVANVRNNPAQPFYTTVNLVNGAWFQVDLREVVSQNLFIYGSFEEHLTAFFLKFLKPGMTFVDVGAHFGYFSAIASVAVGPTGRVVAFEPTQATFKRLEINTRALSNVSRHRKAVWHESGSLAINNFGPSNSAYNSVTEARAKPGQMPVVSTETVEAVRLDDMFAEKDPAPALIKIDVESAELHVIRGMDRLLKTVRPVVTVEVGDMQHLTAEGVPTSRAVLSVFEGYGYRLMESHWGILRPHALKDDGAYEYDNIVAVPSEHPLAAAPDGKA